MIGKWGSMGALLPLVANSGCIYLCLFAFICACLRFFVSRFWPAQLRSPPWCCTSPTMPIEHLWIHKLVCQLPLRRVLFHLAFFKSIIFMSILCVWKPLCVHLSFSIPTAHADVFFIFSFHLEHRKTTWFNLIPIVVKRLFTFLEDPPVISNIIAVQLLHCWNLPRRWWSIL